MRKLASVVEIESCVPVEGTDRLSVATMVGKGWRVVTGRDEFRPGDLAVYFEIDSFLPTDDERYAFLWDRCLKRFVSKSGQILREGIRIKTCKLRGVVSQGLLFPISAYPELSGSSAVGDDLTEVLKVEHYDEVAESLRPATGGGNPIAADAYGKFPTDYIPKTDEERIQNLGDYFRSMRGREFEVTEKNDGSSVTVFLSGNVDREHPFGVCSRNIRLKPEGANGVPLPWRMAEKYGLLGKLERANALVGSELAFQGELVGPGVNGNRDRYTNWEWHVFKVWDILHGRYLLPSEARTLCKALEIPYVPVVSEGMKVFDIIKDVDSILAFAEGRTANGNEREGLVFKSVDEPYVSFKAVSNRYLMKEEG